MVCESESTTTSTPFASLLGGEVNIHLERRGGAVNIAKFEQLRAQGRMTPAGERAFASRTEGRSVIYAYEQQSTAELSPEEVRTFKRHKLAWRFFEAIASLGGGLFRARHARARQVQSTSTLELSEVEPRTSATCTSMVIGRTCRFATDPRVTFRYCVFQPIVDGISD
jgi:hypothetical protein